MSTRFKVGGRTHTIRELFNENKELDTCILGWIQNKSRVGGVIFLTIRDGSGYIQATFKKDNVPNEVFEKVKEATVESAVKIVGRTKQDKRAPGGLEIVGKDFETIAKAEPWPIVKSAVKAPSFLYDIRHLSIRGKKASSVIKIRSKVIEAAADYFFKNGFYLISAPTIVQSACEGGATLFEVNYFGKKAFLTQSAQLYEEAAIMALERVWTVEPCFRAEKSKTSKHLTEFWMIEAEVAFATHDDIMRLEEELVVEITNRVAQECTYELNILGRKFKPPEPPFYRITYDEARELIMKKGVFFEWGEDIPTEGERIISNEFDKPVFIKEFPLSARSFYHMTRPDNDKVTLSSDLIAPEGYGEITTGGQRLSDYNELEKRVMQQELPRESFEWYLDLRKYGMPPHSGFGLGVERTVRWIAGLKHIRAASLFPRTLTRLNP
ncbi:MAG: asparagine--tRNA ligase [Nitrososphaeria archaeon]